MNASEDRTISERERWKESVRYLQDIIKDRLHQSLFKIIFFPNHFLY